MRDGVPVVLASRCPAGAVSMAYAFPGGGATWVRAGAIPAGTLCAIKARVALSLGLGAGLGRDELAALLADPVG
jgi:L-asparaginase